MKKVDKSKKKKILFISSMGGHLNELVQLKPLMDKYDSMLITEKNETTEYLKKKFDNVKYLRYGTKSNKLKYIYIFGMNIIDSFINVWSFRPDVIITTGTHTAVPTCYIGKIFGAKVVFIETFANIKSKTVSGKLVYPIADKFIVQWESMKEKYKKSDYWGWIF